MEICLITPGPDRTVAPFLHYVGNDSSEITGPVFDPSGTRQYFNSQRGPSPCGFVIVLGRFTRTGRVMRGPAPGPAERKPDAFTAAGTDASMILICCMSREASLRSAGTAPAEESTRGDHLDPRPVLARGDRRPAPSLPSSAVARPVRDEANNVWLLARRADALDALHQPTVFSSDGGFGEFLAGRIGPSGGSERAGVLGLDRIGGARLMIASDGTLAAEIDVAEVGADLAEMSTFFFSVAEQRRQDPEDDLISAIAAAAVEEGLRDCGPVQALFRRTTEDCMLGGAEIPAEANVGVLFAAANRDEAVFPDADRYVIGRPGGEHVAFGHAIHYCLGAQLARLETRVVLEAMAERGIDLGPAGPSVRAANTVLHAYTSIPVTAA